MTPRYMGNYPNSADYDPAIPIGYWHWDVPENDLEKDIELENESEDTATNNE